MKRFSAFLLAVIVCIGLCACNKKSENAQKADDLILTIGDVTLDSEKAILAASEFYNTLTDDEKNQVENYAVLEKSASEYDRIKKESIYAQALALEKKAPRDAKQQYLSLPSDYKDVAARLTSLDEVIYVIDTIDQIGLVDENSENAIVNAEQLYSALNTEQQKNVVNYNVLETARAEFNAIPKTVELTVDNFEEYFTISNSASTSKSVEASKVFTHCRTYLYVNTTVQPAVTLASMDNVSVTIQYSLSKEIDGEYSGVDGEKTVTINISAQSGLGEISKSYYAYRAKTGNYSSKSHCFNMYFNSYTIVGVTGIVKCQK